MNSREERGKAIAEIDGSVKRIDANTYIVASQSGQGAYDVLKGTTGWLCSCPDFIYRDLTCKHIFAVEYSFALRTAVSVNQIEPILNSAKCLLCASESIVKFGVQHNRSGDIQRFRCKACSHVFIQRLGFEGMKASPQIITGAMQLYFTGESLRNVQKFLRLQGVQTSHMSIYRWIRKYVRLMESYLDEIKPQVGDTWRADELYLKVKGNPKYLYSLMDDQTRFWIAQQVGGNKNAQTAIQDAKDLFKQGEESIGQRPKVLITDGLHAYKIACKKTWWSTFKARRTIHIRHVTFTGGYNNNKMERMNGEIRDREKVLRGLKKENSPILKGCQIYHNYLRPHEALGGRTPAEASGIQISGENRWMTVIQNAALVTKP